MPQRRTREKKEEKKEERISFMIINHYTRNVLLPASAPAVIVMSAALVGWLFYT